MLFINITLHKMAVNAEFFLFFFLCMYLIVYFISGNVYLITIWVFNVKKITKVILKFCLYSKVVCELRKSHQDTLKRKSFGGDFQFLHSYTRRFCSVDKVFHPCWHCNEWLRIRSRLSLPKNLYLMVDCLCITRVDCQRTDQCSVHASKFVGLVIYC